ncbi:MAG: hypothetical protein ABIZ49_01730 [Opitutaceae bacterium]
MAAQPTHKVCLFAALGFVVLSAAAFGVLGWRNIDRGSGPVETVKLADTPYTPAIAEAANLSHDGWTPPSPQTRGRDWVYDTFTPPEIFYNARSRQFTVKPPDGFVDEEPAEFGLELVAVRPEPFRLQLIGYVGDDGNWRGTFENLLSGEVFLAGAGRRVPNLALQIKSLDVRPQPVALAESMTTQQRVATAVVFDERTSRDVTLTHRERQFTGTLSALVAVPGSTATREMRMGDVAKFGDSLYRIEKIQLAPPSLDVTKETPGAAQPERRTLFPREVEGAEAPSPSPGS